MEIKHLRSILIIGLIVGAVYFLPNIIGFVNNFGVKGASTERAQKISEELGSDIDNQVDKTKKQILNIKISDIIDGASKLSKISQDIKNGQKYLNEQLDNVIKSKK